jgi:hypothetical protein
VFETASSSTDSGNSQSTDASYPAGTRGLNSNERQEAASENQIKEAVSVTAVSDGCLLCTRLKSFDPCLVLFEQFVERMSPVLFSTLGVEVLQIQLVSLHQLLYYFDANFAAFLCKHGMTTDIYAPSWLITLFARRQPVATVLQLWDRMLDTGKPYLVLFIGLYLLLRKKDLIMSLPKVSVPQALVQIHIEGIDDIDQVISHALALEKSTPASAVAEINKVGFDAAFPESLRASKLLDMMVRAALSF